MFLTAQFPNYFTLILIYQDQTWILTPQEAYATSIEIDYKRILQVGLFCVFSSFFYSSELGSPLPESLPNIIWILNVKKKCFTPLYISNKACIGVKLIFLTLYNASFNIDMFSQCAFDEVSKSFWSVTILKESKAGFQNDQKLLLMDTSIPSCLGH